MYDSRAGGVGHAERDWPADGCHGAPQVAYDGRAGGMDHDKPAWAADAGYGEIARQGAPGMAYDTRPGGVDHTERDWPAREGGYDEVAGHGAPRPSYDGRAGDVGHDERLRPADAGHDHAHHGAPGVAYDGRAGGVDHGERGWPAQGGYGEHARHGAPGMAYDGRAGGVDRDQRGIAYDGSGGGGRDEWRRGGVAFGGYQAARTAPWRAVRVGGAGGETGSRRRRRWVVAGVAAAAAIVGVCTYGPVDGAIDPGRAIGVLTGDATALAPELVAPPGPGAPGAGRNDAEGSAAPAGGPESTVVGTDDDVVVPSGAARGGPASPGEAGETTETTRGTTSTSTTLPPIPTHLAVTAVEVPSTAPGSTDGCGKDVAFDSQRMVDDHADTAWRMEGDGSGQTLTLSLGAPHRIVSVGMIPGYALTDPCDGTDRFAQNRRITKVTWQFNDGSAPVVQDLRDAAEMQRVAVSAQASTVTVRIDGVTAEPERDFTAISEIDVRGT